MSVEHTLGVWFVARWRARLADAGPFVTAKQMRKQGVPLEVARLVLLGKGAQ
jgi:hypothetical protein